MLNKKKEVNDYTMRYIEIYTLFDSLFSLSRILTGKIITENIEKLEIVTDKTMGYTTENAVLLGITRYT